MMRCFFTWLFISHAFGIINFAQVQPSYLYNASMPYGTLDIRTVISPTFYYYLDEGKTFSYRESAPGGRTNTYRDMTPWESSAYLQGNLRVKNGASDAFVMNYRLLVPQNYQSTYTEGYPLIVLMHGGGERGNCYYNDCFHATQTYDPNANLPPAPTTVDHELLNNDYNLVMGGKQHLDARNLAGTYLPNDPAMPTKAFPGFVLIPQMLNVWDSVNVQDLIRIVRLHCEKYNIDQNRIYIHGLSIGGYAVYEAIQRAPWLFDAALPMSAVKYSYIVEHNLPEKIAHIPIWIFQGAIDKNPSPSRTTEVVNNLKNTGASVRYTEYPGMGHSIWNKAYGEPDFFSWMLSKSKASIHLHSGNTIINKSKNQYPKLMMAEGFFAYQWQFNGQIIPEATSAVYVPNVPGIYKARFSRVENPTEAQWNKWSPSVEIKEESVIVLPKAEIRQEGTVILNDLNNFTDARLHAVGDFAHYYWYKDGTRIDFPGDQDDTIKNPIIKPVQGSGVYTLATADAQNNLSVVSDGKYIFFNNEAPVNITAPLNFTGVADAPAGINLNWLDVSGNENGFELWRRRKINATTFSSWQMIALTEANKISFNDTPLLLNATYQYKIRAVSNSGRSNYAPATDNLEVIAGRDVEPPTTPGDLHVTPVGVQKLKLVWKASADNIGIRQYYVYRNGDSVATNSTDTTYLFSNLALNKMFTFRIKAVDMAGNLSLPSDAQQGSTSVSGLFYEYYTGVVKNLDSVQWSKPRSLGMLQSFSLSPKTQEDFFSFRFDGFLSITKSGTYEFRIGSDDGSRLELDDKLLVDNNGVHTFKTIASSPQMLENGIHRIRVEFFDYKDTDSLIVEYKGPDTNEQWGKMSAAVLTSTANAIVTEANANVERENNFIFNLYPNPVTSRTIEITLQTTQHSPVIIQIIDPLGTPVLYEEADPASLIKGMTLSLPSLLSPGIYIVLVCQGKATARQRVMIRN